MNDLFETIICQKVAKIFENCNKNVFLFTDKWLNSNLNKNIIEKNPAIISQGYQYILNMFFDEVGTLQSTSENLNKDNMFWFGYILTYIQFNYNIVGPELWDKYEVINALSSADVLHTLSNKIAAETILHDYDKAPIAKLKVFGDYMDQQAN